MDNDARATARDEVVAIVRQYAPMLVVVLPPVRRREFLLAATDEKGSENVCCRPSWAQRRRREKGKVQPRPSEFERAYVFGRHPVMTVSSAFFEARTSKSRPRCQWGRRVQDGGGSNSGLDPTIIKGGS